MKIRMRVQMSGTHNGETWPDLGEVGDVDAAAAEKMIAAGLAEKPGKHSDDAEVEARPAAADDVEKRPAHRPAKK